jgi:hypothetical protein
MYLLVWRCYIILKLHCRSGRNIKILYDCGEDLNNTGYVVQTGLDSRFRVESRRPGCLKQSRMVLANGVCLVILNIITFIYRVYVILRRLEKNCRKLRGQNRVIEILKENLVSLEVVSIFIFSKQIGVVVVAWLEICA